jgi:hypothetical protein
MNAIKKEDASGPGCFWYPKGNAKVVAGAHYDRESKIGAWTNVICFNDHTELHVGLTNGETYPTLVGTVQAFQAIPYVDGVEYFSTSKKLVRLMKNRPAIDQKGWSSATRQCWYDLNELAAKHRLKWKWTEDFKSHRLLLPGSPLFELFNEYLKLCEGRRTAGHVLREFGLPPLI